MAESLALKKSHNPVGRPPKFKSVQELENKFSAYQQDLKSRQETEPDLFPTITDICVFFKICRDTFYSLAKKPEFSDTIKNIHTFCERELEKRMYAEKGSPIKYIFGLKNLGWSDSGQNQFGSKSTRIGGNVIIIKTSEKPQLNIDGEEVIPDEID